MCFEHSIRTKNCMCALISDPIRENLFQFFILTGLQFEIFIYICRKLYEMEFNQVLNRQPGSISWAAFLELAALLAKPPTMI